MKPLQTQNSRIGIWQEGVKLELHYKDELKKEYRNIESWLEQFANILSSTIWFVGYWCLLTTVLIGGQAIILFITQDFNGAQLEDIQSFAEYSFYLTGGITAIVLFVLGLPTRMRNVFADAANYRIEKHKQVKRELDNQVETVDTLLLTYGLISQEDIHKREIHED